MKKIIIAAFAAVLASCASAPVPVTPATAPAATPAPTPIPPKVVTFEEALPLVIKSFYPNGDPSGTVNFKYNEKGLVVLQQTYNGNGVLTETRTGKPNGNGWRITVTNAQNGDVVSFEDLTTDAGGQVLSQTFLNPKEVPQASNEYTFDAQGHKVLWLAKTGAGGLQGRTVYAYDSRGNNIKTELYDAGGTLTNIYLNTYDDLGQILSQQGFDASNNLVEVTNFTWKDGKKIKEETVKPLLRTQEYVYSAQSLPSGTPGPDTKAVPTGIVSSVRGKVVERQTYEYQWFTKTMTVAP